MNYQLIPKELRPIAEKVEAQQRISEGDALTLYGANDLNALGIIANVVRERKKRQLRDLHPQSIHQLLKHLHLILPVLRVCRQETRRARIRIRN